MAGGDIFDYRDQVLKDQGKPVPKRDVDILSVRDQLLREKKLKRRPGMAERVAAKVKEIYKSVGETLGASAGSGPGGMPHEMYNPPRESAPASAGIDWENLPGKPEQKPAAQPKPDWRQTMAAKSEEEGRIQRAGDPQEYYKPLGHTRRLQLQQLADDITRSNRGGEGLSAGRLRSAIKDLKPLEQAYIIDHIAGSQAFTEASSREVLIAGLMGLAGPGAGSFTRISQAGANLVERGGAAATVGRGLQKGAQVGEKLWGLEGPKGALARTGIRAASGALEGAGYVTALELPELPNDPSAWWEKMKREVPAGALFGAMLKPATHAMFSAPQALKDAMDLFPPKKLMQIERDVFYKHAGTEEGQKYLRSSIDLIENARNTTGRSLEEAATVTGKANQRLVDLHPGLKDLLDHPNREPVLDALLSSWKRRLGMDIVKPRPPVSNVIEGGAAGVAEQAPNTEQPTEVAEYLRLIEEPEAQATGTGGLPALANRNIVMLEPEQIAVHPEIQYKSQGITDVKNQVSDLLKDIREYDVRQGKILTAWRRLDGSLYIAHGHHRLELAKRADRFVLQVPDGKGGMREIELPRQLPVEILDESEDWTLPLVRGYSAIENIRDQAGTAVDAATAIQEAGITPEELVRRFGIGPKTPMFRHLKGLLKLHPEAMDYARRGDVPEAVAAGIGEILPDADMQLTALQGAQNAGLHSYEQAIFQAQNLKRDNMVRQASGDQRSIMDLLGGDDSGWIDTSAQQAQIQDGIIRRLQNKRSDLLKPTDAELWANEFIDAEGRKAAAGEIADSGRAIAEKLGAVFGYDGRLIDAIRTEAARVARGEIKIGAAIDGLIGQAIESARRPLADVVRGAESAPGETLPEDQTGVLSDEVTEEEPPSPPEPTETEAPTPRGNEEPSHSMTKPPPGATIAPMNEEAQQKTSRSRPSEPTSAAFGSAEVKPSTSPEDPLFQAVFYGARQMSRAEYERSGYAAVMPWDDAWAAYRNGDYAEQIAAKESELLSGWKLQQEAESRSAQEIATRYQCHLFRRTDDILSTDAGLPDQSPGTPQSGRYLYHFTSALALPRVATDGLTPQKSGTGRAEDRIDASGKRFSASERVYAADNAAILSSVDRDAQDVPGWVLLRFRIGTGQSWKADPEYAADDKGSWWSKATIPAHEIETWSGRDWHELRDVEAANQDPNQSAPEMTGASTRLRADSPPSGDKPIWDMTEQEWLAQFPEFPPPPEFAESAVREPVYHGSGNGGIEQFFTDQADLGSNTGAGTARLGAFFSEDPTIAKMASFGFDETGAAAFDTVPERTLYEARINLRNPLDLDNATPRELNDLETVLPGIIKAWKQSPDHFRVVQFLAGLRESQPHPDLRNFADYAVERGISPDAAKRLFIEKSDPVYQEWQRQLSENIRASVTGSAQRILREKGYDGIIVRTIEDSGDNLGPKRQYIVFDPEDIHVVRRTPVVDHRVLVEIAAQDGKIGAGIRNYPDLMEQYGVQPGHSARNTDVITGQDDQSPSLAISEPWQMSLQDVRSAMGEGKGDDWIRLRRDVMTAGAKLEHVHRQQIRKALRDGQISPEEALAIHGNTYPDMVSWREMPEQTPDSARSATVTGEDLSWENTEAGVQGSLTGADESFDVFNLVPEKAAPGKPFKAPTSQPKQTSLTDLEGDAAERINSVVHEAGLPIPGAGTIQIISEPPGPPATTEPGRTPGGGGQSRRSPYAYRNPNAELRWTNASAGLQKPSVFQQVGVYLEELIHMATRTWKDLPRGGYYARAHETLRQLQAQKPYQSRRTLQFMQSITLGMKPDDFDLFRRCVVLNDLIAEPDDQAIPFFDSRAELQAEWEEKTALAATKPKVAQAIQTRRELWSAIKDDYISSMEAIGFQVGDRFRRTVYWEGPGLPPENEGWQLGTNRETGEPAYSRQVDREDYYRHMVLEYANAELLQRIRGTKGVHTPAYRGFLKRREGSSLDINAAYLEAEYEVMAQMLYDAEIARAIGSIRDSYDITTHCKDFAKATNRKTIDPYFAMIANLSNAGLLGMDVEEALAGVAEAGTPLQRRAARDFATLPAAVTGSDTLLDSETVLRRMLNWKQAKAFKELSELAAAKVLPDTPTGYFSQVIESLTGEADEEFDPEGKPSVMQYLAWIMGTYPDTPAGSAAATFFRGLDQKKKTIRALAGDKFVTWQDVVGNFSTPLGTPFTLWQPLQGNQFYSVQGVAPRVIEELVEGALEQVGLTQEDLTSHLAMGGPRLQLVLPEELASTLDHFGDPVQHSFLGNVARSIIKPWKQFVLLNPKSLWLYNVRNQTGDLEPILRMLPSALKYTGRAMQELWQMHRTSRAATGEMAEYMKRGGGVGGLTVQEIGDVDQLSAFVNLYAKRGKWQQIPITAFQKYWQGARLTTDFRENILRYAAYLSFLEQLQTLGRVTTYGASIPEEVNALYDERDPDRSMRDMAFKMSNELLGAYDETTQLGRELADSLLPFWRWREINCGREIRMLRNVYADPYTLAHIGHEFGLPGMAKLPGADEAGRGHGDSNKAFKAAAAGIRVGRFVVTALSILGMYEAYNRLRFPREEEDMPDSDRARPHLILGRNPDGTIRYIPRLGAVADFLSWGGLDEFPGIARDILNGDRSIKEIAAEMMTSPISEAVGSIGPVKMAAELAFGQSMYPDPFNPRDIQDRTEYFLKALRLDEEYRWATGKPRRPYDRPFGNALWRTVDPEEAAYYDILQYKAEFLDKVGKSRGTWEPAGTAQERSSALGMYKKAVRYGDQKAAAKYLQRYQELAAKNNVDWEAGLSASIRMSDPLFGLGDLTGMFMKSLSERGKHKLELAQQYWQKLEAVSPYDTEE